MRITPVINVFVQRAARATIAAALLLLSLTPSRVAAGAQAVAQPGAQADVIQVIATALEDGRRQTAAHLTRLGFGSAVTDASTLDGQRIRGLSSQMLIEHLYHRAEAHAIGEGERFLA